MAEQSNRDVASYSLLTMDTNGGKWLRVVHGACDAVVYEARIDDGHLAVQLSLALEHNCPDGGRADDCPEDGLKEDDD